MTVRCKMKCQSKVENADGSARINLSAVYGGSPENEKFFKYTPAGTLDFYGVNVEANAQIEPGKEYYIDITEA